MHRGNDNTTLRWVGWLGEEEGGGNGGGGLRCEGKARINPDKVPRAATACVCVSSVCLHSASPSCATRDGAFAPSSSHGAALGTAVR